MAEALLFAAVVLVAMTAVMVSAWWVQRRAGNAGWIDVFWTFGTGVSCIAAAILSDTDGNGFRQLLVAALAGLWSLRLGIYMAGRVASSPEDLRYVELRRQWGGQFQSRLLRFVLWQPPTTALLVLSVYAAAHSSGPIGWRDLAGVAMLAIAIAGETIADGQMRRYKQRENRPPVMDRGLWGRSRHPNYFFDWLGWLAYPVIAFDPQTAAGWLTLVAPGLMYLVLRHATGVPMLEASMLERKGKPFRDYQANVNAFFPSLRSGTKR
jgi:steroid 5-alpha reductase family enzyme